MTEGVDSLTNRRLTLLKCIVNLIAPHPSALYTAISIDCINYFIERVLKWALILQYVVVVPSTWHVFTSGVG